MRVSVDELTDTHNRGYLLELYAVAACILKRLAVSSKLAKVCGQDGWDDLHLARLSVEVEASASASGSIDRLERDHVHCSRKHYGENTRTDSETAGLETRKD